MLIILITSYCRCCCCLCSCVASLLLENEILDFGGMLAHRHSTRKLQFIGTNCEHLVSTSYLPPQAKDTLNVREVFSKMDPKGMIKVSVFTRPIINR